MPVKAQYALAQVIQRRVHTHKINADLELQNNRPLSKQEWAALVGLDGLNDL